MLGDVMANIAVIILFSISRRSICIFEMKMRLWLGWTGRLIGSQDGFFLVLRLYIVIGILFFAPGLINRASDTGALSWLIWDWRSIKLWAPLPGFERLTEWQFVRIILPVYLRFAVRRDNICFWAVELVLRLRKQYSGSTIVLSLRSECFGSRPPIWRE